MGSLLIVLRAFGNMSTDFLYLLLFPKAANKSRIPKFELSYFTSNFNVVFLQNDHLCWLMMDHKNIYYFISKRGPNSEISHVWKAWFNTWNSKTQQMSKIQWIQHNTVSTLAFNIHLFNFPLCIMLCSIFQGLTLIFLPTCPFGQVPYLFYLPETVNY